MSPSHARKPDLNFCILTSTSPSFAVIFTYNSYFFKQEGVGSSQIWGKLYELALWIFIFSQHLTQGYSRKDDKWLSFWHAQYKANAILKLPLSLCGMLKYLPVAQLKAEIILVPWICEICEMPIPSYFHWCKWWRSNWCVGREAEGRKLSEYDSDCSYV